MTKRPMSEHAKAAKALRAEIKAMGVPVLSARSESYSGGSSVRVYIPMMGRKGFEAIDHLKYKYEYGSFNAMEDIYEYHSDRDADIPTAKFVFIERENDYGLFEKMKEWIRPMFGFEVRDCDMYRYVNEFLLENREELEKFADANGMEVKVAKDENIFWIA